MRILTGEGAGQLAGSEDKASFNQLVSDRQNLVCQEWVERVFEILQLASLVDYQPDYRISWLAIEALDAFEQSKVAQNNSTAFKNVTEALSSIVLDGNVDANKVYAEVLGLELDFEIDDEDLGDRVGETPSVVEDDGEE